MDKQWSTKHYTKEPTNNRCEFRCFPIVNSSCSTSGTRSVSRRKVRWYLKGHQKPYFEEDLIQWPTRKGQKEQWSTKYYTITKEWTTRTQPKPEVTTCSPKWVGCTTSKRGEHFRFLPCNETTMITSLVWCIKNNYQYILFRLQTCGSINYILALMYVVEAFEANRQCSFHETWDFNIHVL